MCEEKNIEGLLEQLRYCENTEKMRLALEDLDTCRKCSKMPKNTEFQCRCRKLWQLDIANRVYFLLNLQ